MEKWEAQFEKMVTDAAQAAFDTAIRTGCRNLYLYYQESSPYDWGKLRVVTGWEPTPEGFHLAINHRLPMNRTVAGIRAFIYPHCRRLEILPSAPDAFHDKE